MPMTSQITGLWLTIAVLTGAVGTGMTVYGIKQREPIPLVFGLAIGAVPMITNSGWLSALLAVLVTALYFVVRKYR